MKNNFKTLMLICSVLLVASAAHAEKITVAAAADLKFALDEVVTAFKKSHPTEEVEVIYGSSGKAHTQIQQGAPYDLYFSADVAFPQELIKGGFAASTEVTPYALGRIVLWSSSRDACVFRSKSATDSVRIRPLIPFQTGRVFRWKAATDSGGIRPPC